MGEEDCSEVFWIYIKPRKIHENQRVIYEHFFLSQNTSGPQKCTINHHIKAFQLHYFKSIQFGYWHYRINSLKKIVFFYLLYNSRPTFWKLQKNIFVRGSNKLIKQGQNSSDIRDVLFAHVLYPSTEGEIPYISPRYV